jgi:hypothetical protein
MKAWLLVGLFQSFAIIGFACSMFGAPSPAVVTATAECEHYLVVLRAAKSAGKTCAAGKAEAEAAEPQCKLTFECPMSSEGGTDADAAKDR